MQLSGRLIILSTFGLAIAMSAGAWLYHYSQVRQAAAFWGNPGGRLLVRGTEVTFFELGEFESGAADGERIAGRPIQRQVELSSKPGLVHLRHALYQDASFHWSDRKREPVSGSHDWSYAVRFGEGGQELLVLFSRNFARVGKLQGDEVDGVPSARIADSVEQYLSDIGVLEEKSSR